MRQSPDNQRDDASNGYESVAAEYTRRRDASTIGVETVRAWSRALPRGAAVLDLGCGSGVPISVMLVQEGFGVHGVDASVAQVAAFRARLPAARVACEPVETSSFFDRNFDGVVAIGLMFLLSGDAQGALIRKVGRALKPGGRFLFTAPWQACSWTDALTGRRSRSIGGDAFRKAFAQAGLSLIGECDDEGENHYYDVQRACEGEDPVR